MTISEHDVMIRAMREAEALAVPLDRVAVRKYSADLDFDGKGRTVDLRIVPYGERAQANDGLGGLPRGVTYTEEFVSGVFDHVLTAPNRVLLDFEHSERVDGIVGRGLEVANRSDGFHGSFKFLETPAGETALELVREGVLAGASVECFFQKSIRGADGVVRRVKARLNKVALCREPAYTGAIVLGVRKSEPESEIEFDDDLKPAPFDADLASRIAALGITIPDRLKTDPSQSDPSATADPSESTPPNGDDDANVDSSEDEHELSSGGPARSPR